ncbi:MAG: hypothetical protein ACLQG3_01240 [Terracidiphilus sp.]
MKTTLNVCGRDIKIRGRAIRIARIDGDNYRFLDDPEAMISGLKQNRKRIDLFTFMQRVPETQPKFKYPMEWDNVAALPITSFDDWWNRVLGFKGRNKAKQAEKKGVELREVPYSEELVEGIWRIYNESPVRQGKRFPHFGMSLEKVREHAGTFLDCSVFIGAFFDGELIGFAKLTMDETGTQAGLMHILSMIKHREKAPTNALIVQAVRSCAARKIAYLVYSQFSYGNKQRDSLSDFKERNGFQRIDIPRYYVPLTWLGEAAFRAGMHRSLIERLPEPLITRLRDYRAAWYSRSMPAKSEAR